jgi:uncharacterized protein (TIGR02271 family)
VLSVTVDDDTKIHQAITILEAHHPVDIDEYSDDAESSGLLSGTAAHSSVGKEFSSGEVAQAGSVGPAPTGRALGAGSGRVGAIGTMGGTPGGQGEVIPLAEEQLEVGKRTVDRGTTRIRRYVVERPVEENITLRGERVTVERRQPTGTAAASGAGVFEERVVEVRETGEEPVVSKSAHVAEEVVVGRETTERTETVRDTVRRDEVEVSPGVNDRR